MSARTAILVVDDVRGLGPNARPLALREIAGRTLLDRCLAAFGLAGMSKVLVLSTLNAAQVSVFKKKFKFARWISARSGTALAKATRALPASGSVLISDGLCPLADPAYLKRLAQVRPAEAVVAAGCGHDCSDEHGGLARVNLGVAKKVFSRGANLGDFLHSLEAQSQAAPVLEANFYQDLAVRNLADLADAARMIRSAIAREHMERGVEIADPDNTWIDESVKLAPGSVILPYSFLAGQTKVGSGSVIGPFARLADCQVDADCRVEQSVAEGARIRKGAGVGPWSRLRKGSDIGEGAKLGNFCEFKNSKLGPGVKAGHLSYLGDAVVGADTNIGAGTITANYDGKNKNKTVLGAGAFTGSNTVLVAPVSLGAGAKTGAGSVVLAGRNVPKGAVAVGAPARLLKKKRK